MKNHLNQTFILGLKIEEIPGCKPCIAENFRNFPTDVFLSPLFCEDSHFDEYFWNLGSHQRTENRMYTLPETNIFAPGFFQ